MLTRHQADWRAEELVAGRPLILASGKRVADGRATGRRTRFRKREILEPIGRMRAQAPWAAGAR